MTCAKQRIPALPARGFWLCAAGIVLIKLVLASFQMAYTWWAALPWTMS